MKGGKKLRATRFFFLFLRIILHWQLPQRVERSLETEQPIVDPDNLEVVHSSSAHDFTSSVALLKEFWRIFNWGELTNPRPHLAILIDVSLAACNLQLCSIDR